MLMNNAPWIYSLDQNLLRPPPPRRRTRVTSDPCLPERLPNAGVLQREAEHEAPKAILRQLRRSPSPTDSPVFEADEDPPGHKRTLSLSSVASSASSTKALGSSLVQRKQNGQIPIGWKEPQPFEILRAIERKDNEYIGEVRDKAFHLLVRMSGGVTPLMHAMRLGPSHREVAILLIGAFSRWVNNLEDDQMEDPRTKVILKALRTNLKLAIDYGLTKTQGSDLTASFLQTLVMSQGEVWVLGQAGNVSLALRAGTEGRPVQTADAAVRKFATRELGKADLIASLADYMANATADLLLMGAWMNVSEVLELGPIPTYYFARDDRVYRAFVDRLDEHKNAIQYKVSKRLRWQLRVMRTVLEGRSTTFRSKVELLRGELDEGEGV
ncbi:hypothetical protein FB45DRAFT_740212 [Roridomyces roridus]|uniref:Uncharacterized protein n=1 Tax=Roridomyces roridus TaxID=1738132 RepID=A0AAD7FUY5_9AGAR|nr:hypothetical protein FB45DRAFT_740212 [Roridomyces roridus]